MKMLIALAVAVVMLIATPAAYAQDFLWARQMGGVDEENLNDLVLDGANNVYSVGFFEGTADFDPGAGTFDLISAGSRDVFISKIDSAGEFVWARQVGGTSYDSAWSVALDGDGNVYTVGDFRDTADFDPGPGVFNMTSTGSGDVFVLKLDGSGDFVWAKQLGGTRTDYGQGVTVDGNGDVYTIGAFVETVDFDPGPGVFNLSALPPFGDIYIWKLDGSGNFVWAAQLEGPNASSELPHEITVAANGDILLVGRYGGTVDFDPGPGTHNLTSISLDAFAARYNSAGALVWAKHWGGSQLRAYRLALDSGGNVYVTGFFFQGTVDFDPGPGVFNLTSNGASDIFLSKLDGAGDFLWAVHAGSSLGDVGAGVAIDSGDDVHVTGNFRETVDFDPGPGTFNLTSSGSLEGFVWTLDSAGALVRALRIGGEDSDATARIRVGGSDNLFVGGDFGGTADFDPGPGTFNLTSAGDYDAFVWKYGVVEPPPCDADPLSQGYWHRQCLGAGLIGPGRHGRGPLGVLEPGFVDELIPAVDARLEETVFVSRTCEDGMNAFPPGDKCEQALRAYTALLLNIASDHLQESCEIDLTAEGCSSANVSDLVDELAGLINSGHRNDCRQVVDCANAVNQDSGLISVVPLAPSLSEVDPIGTFEPLVSTTP